MSDSGADDYLEDSSGWLLDREENRAEFSELTDLDQIDFAEANQFRISDRRISSRTKVPSCDCCCVRRHNSTAFCWLCCCSAMFVSFAVSTVLVLILIDNCDCHSKSKNSNRKVEQQKAVNLTKNISRNQSHSAVTQFEATYARSMFPCLDEPAFKAKFQVSIVRDKEQVAISNMPVNSTTPYYPAGHQPQRNLVLDKFSTTLKMSTYLLAIAVGKFVKISNKTASNTTVSVYAPEEQIKDASLALDVAVRGLEFLERFFNISFPLPKQDLLAVSDFSSGAMENWGLVTFRDQILLWNSTRSSSSSKEITAIVIIHELAHQWFGNLVTMKWWNDLWLNEGFASFMEYFATAKVNSNWNLMSRFYLDNTMKGLYLDGLSISHPVSSPVYDPADIGSIFDAISYEKGASVINMIIGISGERAFQLGLKDYLQKFQYRNAEGEDLWTILGKYISTLDGMSLSVVAKAWTTQVGYPLIQVELSGDRRKVYVNQSRFLYLKEKRRTEKTGLWPVPLTYKTDRNSTVERVWMKQTAKQIAFEQPVNWITFNTGGNGFYRVLYGPTIYTALTEVINNQPSMLSPGDRGSLLCDVYSFSKAGLLPIETVLDLLEYIGTGREMDLVPLTVAIEVLTGIDGLVWETDFLHEFRAYQRSLLGPTYQRLGWNRYSEHSKKLLQQTVLAAACRLEIEDCVEKAKQKFYDWLYNNKSYYQFFLKKYFSVLRGLFRIPPDHQSLVYSIGIKHGNMSVWNRVYDEYTRSTLPSEQALYLGALTKSRDAWQLYQYLEMILDTHKVKPNLMNKVLLGIARNPIGRRMAWRFYRANWENILERVGKTTMLGNGILAVVSDFATNFDYEEVKNFFHDKDLGRNKRKYLEALETIQINIQWRGDNELRLKRWLQNRKHGLR